VPATFRPKDPATTESWGVSSVNAYGPWRDTGVAFRLWVGRRIAPIGLTVSLVRFGPQVPGTPITSDEPPEAP